MTNPYAPATADSTAQASAKLYSPGHVAWASFLGAPIAGAVLLAINYTHFGNSTAAKVTLFTGFIATGLLLAIAFTLPDNFPSWVLPVASTFVMFQCTKLLQGTNYKRRLANGGLKASAWAATGVGMLCIFFITAALFAGLLAAPVEWFGEEF